MHIQILCIGKLKEAYWSDAIKEYSKRLSRYCRLTINELKEEKLTENASEAQEINVKQAEGKNLLKQLKKETYVIALDVRGKVLSSEQLAEKVEQLGIEGKHDIAFIIGGSLGLSPDVLQRADFRLSFSAMTFPHQMMRVILLEQIYRSFKLIKGETYHK